MNQEALQTIVEKTHELMNAHSCCKEAKAAAQAWLDAIGTENEVAAAKRYVEELEADIMPVDQLIAFANSDAGAQVFGANTAKQIAAHAAEIKAAGAKYCDCPGLRRGRSHPGKEGTPLKIKNGFPRRQTERNGAYRDQVRPPFPTARELNLASCKFVRVGL